MAIRKVKTKTKGTRYQVRMHVGGGKYEVIGTYPTRSAAKEAEAKHLLSRPSSGQRRMTGNAWADFYLEGYKERNKGSSHKKATDSIRVWRKEFGTRTLSTIDPTEAEEWARKHPSHVSAVIAMGNYAVKKQVLSSNPFSGLGAKSKGRKGNTPLSVAEVAQLGESARKRHGDNFAEFITFTAYSGLRVGEVFALEPSDLDFTTNRIHVRRRLYDGDLDLPKSNVERTVVLLPEARDAAMRVLAGRSSATWVFEGKRGGQMNQGKLWNYWQKTCAVIDREVTPHELKHFCGHHLYVTLGMPDRVVAVQLGHQDGGKLVRELYGHGDHGALEEIERLYAERDNVVDLDEKRRKASGE